MCAFTILVRKKNRDTGLTGGWTWWMEVTVVPLMTGPPEERPVPGEVESLWGG